MKRLFIIASIMIALGGAQNSSATYQTFTIKKTQGIQIGGGYTEEEGEEGRHIPGRPFQCTFDTERGIEFIGQETPEFALFEIYVTDSECIYASGDEFDFIDQLFSLSGSYQICLTTIDGCVYAGYLNL